VTRLAATPGASGTAAALLRAARPRQWTKNALVFAAPAAAGVMDQPQAWAWGCFAFVVFCLSAAGTYLLNDAYDAAADRRHPLKRHRPVASGALGMRTAVLCGAGLLALSLTAVVVAGRPGLAAALAGYLALTTAYTVRLKHVAVCDIATVSGCHVLRAVAGAAATGVDLSGWFLLVVSMGALLVVVGKREAELWAVGDGEARSTLNHYTLAFLAQMRTMASGALIVTYCLWALERDPAHGTLLYGVSIVPFILVVLRLNLLLSRGDGEAPEEIPLRDRPTQIFVASTLLLLLVGIYVR
jgi:decaprenyl-phosphate phosphoribosyltransferase